MSAILVIFACLSVNALLSAYEMAFVVVGRPQLRRLMAEGNPTAGRLLSLRNDPERTLSLIQIGITLMGAISGAAGGAAAADLLRPRLMADFGLSHFAAQVLTIALVVIPLTYLTVVVGELIPKAGALRRPYKIALWGTPFVVWLDRLFSPLVSMLAWSTKKAISLIFPALLKKPVEPPPGVTVELEALSEEHRRYVLNLVHLEGRRLQDILLPWEKAVRVRSDDDAVAVKRVALDSRHTRLPVVRDGEAVGILHTKEFLAYVESGAQDWQQIIRPVLKARGDEPLLNALRRMQREHSHMMLVLSGRGVLLGIVTLEDILEEVVGDLYDEDDDRLLQKLLTGHGRVRAGSDTSKGVF